MQDATKQLPVIVKEIDFADLPYEVRKQLIGNAVKHNISADLGLSLQDYVPPAKSDDTYKWDLAV